MPTLSKKKNINNNHEITTTTTTIITTTTTTTTTTIAITPEQRHLVPDRVTRCSVPRNTLVWPREAASRLSLGGATVHFLLNLLTAGRLDAQTRLVTLEEGIISSRRCEE